MKRNEKSIALLVAKSLCPHPRIKTNVFGMMRSDRTRNVTYQCVVCKAQAVRVA